MPHEPGKIHAPTTTTAESAAREGLRRRGLLFPSRSQLVPALFGTDHLGRPYVETSLPWVVGAEAGVVEVDTEIAARYGVVFREDAAGVVLVEA